MAQEKKYLYHCDRCGELFKSIQLTLKEIRCNSCGEHPVKPKFASVSEMPALDRTRVKSTHGIPGKDEADHFSMNKKRQRQKWMFICFIWVVGLAVMALIANKMNNKATVANSEEVALDDEDKVYLARKNEAVRKCSTCFIKFASQTAVHAKSTHILNGSDLVLDINRYYEGNLMKNDLAASKIISFEMIEANGQTKAISKMRYTSRTSQKSETYDFEVLYWKVGEEWYIDWPHFVRLGDMNWFRFGENMEKNSPKRFKLYARELSAESLGLSGYEEYKFSEAYNNSNLPSQLSKSVFVKHQTTLKSQLSKRFRELKESRKAGTNKLQLSFDPPRTIRLDVTVDFQVIEDETVIVLKDIHDMDWETPPNK